MKPQLHFRFSPFFLLISFLIGYIFTQNIMSGILWTAAIFLSILVHELGHACVALFFKQSVLIQFTAFGGATMPLGKKLRPAAEFLMVLMGPLFGFSLYLLASYILSLNITGASEGVIFFNALKYINLVWTIVNLFPVLPLDGGQLLRIFLEIILGIKGRKIAVLLGGVLAIAFALILVLFKAFFAAIFFFFFAMQNLEIYRQMKVLSNEDESDSIKGELKEAVELSKKHDIHANQKLEEVRSHSGYGLIFVIASQELAENYLAEKDFQKAFEILDPIEDKLLDTGKKLLLKAAFEISRDDRVLDISGKMLVSSPDQEIILLALSSAARKKDIQASIGWLQTAIDYECKDLKSFLQQPLFEEVKRNDDFKSLLEKITI